MEQIVGVDMNDNVGEMPLEIFGDYTSDTLDEEWSWEYLFIFNEQHYFHQFEFGCSVVINSGSGMAYSYSYDNHAALGDGFLMANYGDGKVNLFVEYTGNGRN